MSYVPSPTVAGLSGFGATTSSDSLATALSLFQVNVAKMVGDVVQSVSAISILSKKAAIEWGTNMNNFAAHVAQTLLKKTADGRPYWVRFPDQAKKLLSDAESFVTTESKEYKAAAAHLLSIKGNLKQASAAVTKEVAAVVREVVEGATEGNPWLVGAVVLFAAAWLYGQVK